MENVRWMRWPAWLFGLFFAATTVLYFNCIPAYYDKLQEQCLARGCGLSVPALTMDIAGLSVAEISLVLVAIDVLFTLVFFASALILLWKSPREPVGLLAALAMLAFGTTFPSLVNVASVSGSFAYYWFQGLSAIGWMSISLFCLLFPNGRFVPAWSRYAMLLIAAVNVAGFVKGGQIWGGLPGAELYSLAWFLSFTVLLIYAQIHRFRVRSSPAERQQTKWVVYGIAIAFVGFVVISILFDPRFYDGKASNFIYLNAGLHMSLSALPVTLTIAVLRRRLWAINPLVNRTLVYGALTLCVVLLYAGAVLYLDRLLRAWNPFVVSLIATGLVAAAFAPLKEWLQRRVNRLMKGRHDDPYAVLLELGSRLLEPLAPDAMLKALAVQVQGALRLPYVGIAIEIEGEETFIAEAGERREGYDVHAFPIVYRGPALGTLYALGRSPGEAFTADDERFLELLLRHAGPLVNNADMLQGMRRLTEDLRESREKLVLAREEERRRIRNNLHDELAPRLAALALKTATARKVVEREPASATAILEDLGRDIRTSVGDIRALVNDLRPPALDEFGLVGAIRMRVDELAKTSADRMAAEGASARIDFRVDAPHELPPLRAAVEVAAYRIATESVVNAWKHAEAAVCQVKLDIEADGRLIVEVTDDGVGVGASRLPGWSGQAGGGIGLVSMRERAAEIGGEFAIGRREGGGTRVWVALPLQ
ncbi:GAF domain-containing sensor histidine kinase [Cohnella sp. OV330]|uniref:sensor histidine kinase n=1 Tax=Cohnella sp. OV330 TaxID=1855288 RepID=UPI000B7FF8D7|nr:GAF domain-containing sensor histidine kinase [Cohnella sp. OV330]